MGVRSAEKSPLIIAAVGADWTDIHVEENDGVVKVSPQGLKDYVLLPFGAVGGEIFSLRLKYRSSTPISIRAWDAVAQLEPARSLLLNDPDSEFLMAKACLKTNHPVEGISMIETLESHSQLSVMQAYEFAVLLNQKKMYLDAINRFEYAVKTQPDSWECKYNLAIAWLDTSRSDKAISILEPLAVEQPENATVLSLLGSVYESANQLPQALDAYQKAVSADPQNPDRYQ